MLLLYLAHPTKGQACDSILRVQHARCQTEWNAYRHVDPQILSMREDDGRVSERCCSWSSLAHVEMVAKDGEAAMRACGKGIALLSKSKYAPAHLEVPDMLHRIEAKQNHDCADSSD